AQGFVVNGIQLSQASANTIGGSAAGAGNLISGNSEYGLYTFASPDTVIQGNLIGTDATGAGPLGNGFGGLVIVNSGAQVGGSTAAAGNTISANKGPGVTLTGSAIVVQGNLIGTDATGARPLGNASDGVSVGGSGQDTIAGNVISANTGNGIN